VHGRQRQSLGATLGWRWAILVTAAAAEDGPAAPQVCAKCDAPPPPRLARLWAEHQDDHRTVDRWRAAHQGGDRIEVVERPVGVQGCGLRPRRWVVERPGAGRGRYRQPSQDYARLTASSEATMQVRRMPLRLRRLRPDKTQQMPVFTSRRTPRKAA
jgi:transposase